MDRDRALFEGFSANALRLVLKRLADGGWLHRLERGTYVVAGFRRADRNRQLGIIADWLDGERYVVSGFFALAHWNLTGHPPTTVDVLVTRRKPSVRFGPTLFRFVYTRPAAMPSAREVSVPGARAPALIAGPERALAEVLAGRHAADLETVNEAFERGFRFRVLGRRALLDAMRKAPVAAARRLGWIAERHSDPLAKLLHPLVRKGGYVPLDPKRRSSRAERNLRWRVLENMDLS